MSKSSKFLQWINFRVRVAVADNRMIVGTFLAFDKHMNLVLSDSEEYRHIKSKKTGQPPKEVRRVLGLVLLRGDSIIHMSAEAQPSQPTRRIGETEGKGKAAAMGRGVAIAPVGQAPTGLAGPGRGVGVPGMSHMLPTSNAMSAPPTHAPSPGMGGAQMAPPPGIGRGPGMAPPPGIRPPMPQGGAPTGAPQGMPMSGPPQARPPPPNGVPPGIRPPNSNY
eukprot:CAMPEP_0205833908 /NCGR_PEP_ID=MMETSP0206-20130828/50371_1 /ASSEMBLY_ACC=CAM_ASM_000279 /TAXON_ID=36767 /ORGANISM="Euplotes focardii, Strain TN1" /LENGTH=220 /DNA_ID=CAMNT_0053140669 /DNA_START=19 /DNA_END=681 /DNA_ORIENTATION=+